MSSFLILQTEVPQMALCGICPHPGDCCKGFDLTVKGVKFTAWKDSWEEDSIELLERLQLPFVPAELAIETVADNGDIYGIPRFACSHVSSKGRCEIYENRPHVCRSFVPASDKLCGFHQESTESE